MKTQVYNTLPTGFTESTVNGMCASGDPVLGGIIDKRICR